jgi:hypothetical protein
MPERLDLDRPRDFRDLLDATIALWPRHLPVFVVLAAIVVVPFGLLVRPLDDDAVPGVVAALLVQAFIVPSLVTAAHVAAVEELGRGHSPTVRGSLARSLPVALPVLGATALYLAGIAVGLALLVVPGLWFSVTGYFAPQAAVVERLGPVAAVRRSVALARSYWARVLGIAVAFNVLGGFVIGVVVALMDEVVTGDAAETALALAFDSLMASFTALVATLLFFDLRARDPATQVE